MAKKVSYSKAFATGTKDTIAMSLIALGVKLIGEGDYVVGGFLVFIGWILLIAQKAVQGEE
ncbi:MAG: hypothetical protein QXH03_02665 [Candidatus Bathyarchaeia archaeon]